MDHFHAFQHAITWTEPFVLSLLAFHACMLFTCLFVSRRGRGMYPRLAVMILIGLVVRSAEWLNHYGAQHWREFATQNYFDGQGVFVAVMVCGPLLVFSFIMLVFFLREAAQLLVQVKTAELKKKRRMQNGGDKKVRRKKEQ
jgi:transmembrane protein 18